MFANSGEHARTDFLVVVEGEDEVRPVGSLERPMRSGLSFDSPSDPEKSGKNPACFCSRPVAHAAWKATFTNSAGASRCSRRSAITRSASA